MQPKEQMQMAQEPDGCYMITSYPWNDTDGEDGGISQKEMFVIRMLGENRITGLIRPQVREFNGIKSLYYEVTGKQSLSSFAENKPLEGTMVRLLFETLHGLLERLPEYCLGPEGLSLSLSQIFTDGKTIDFCYFPRVQNDEEQTSVFARELIGMIDQDSEEAVVLAYRFYKLAGDGRGDLQGWMKQLIAGEKERTISDSAEPEENAVCGDMGDNLRSKREPDEECQSKWKSKTRYEKATAENDVINWKSKIGYEKAASDNYMTNSTEEDEEPERNKGSNEAANKRGKDILSLGLFAAVFLIGVFLLAWKLQTIEQFAMALLLSSYEGIVALFFIAAGGLGAGLTFFKS